MGYGIRHTTFTYKNGFYDFVCFSIHSSSNVRSFTVHIYTECSGGMCQTSKEFSLS